MSKARTAVVVALGVLVIGFVARTPVSESDFGPEPSVAEVASEDAEETDEGSEPPDPRRNIARLDPRTLETVRPGLSTVASGWRWGSGGDALVLVEDIAGSTRDQARTVTDLDAPDAWAVRRISDIDDIEWIESRGGSLAWMTGDAVFAAREGQSALQVSVPLEPGRTPLDARQIDEDRVAVLLAQDETQRPSVAVYDMAAGSLLRMSNFVLVESGPGATISYAWDVEDGPGTQHLIVADGPGGLVHSADLATGTIESVALPGERDVPSQRIRTDTLVVDAEGGRVAVSGRARQFANDFIGEPYGVALFDRNMDVLGHLDDRRSSQVALVPDSDLLYAFGEESGARLLDGDLSEVIRILPDLSLTSFQVGPQVSYAVTCPPEEADFCTIAANLGVADSRGRQLHAINSSTGAVLGTRDPYATDEVFLADGALLVSSLPPPSSSADTQ